MTYYELRNHFTTYHLGYITKKGLVIIINKWQEEGAKIK